MRTDLIGTPLYATRMRLNLPVTQRVARPAVVSAQRLLTLQAFGDQLRHLRLALERLGEGRAVSRMRGRGDAQAAEAISSGPLDLAPIASFTTVGSKAEINAVPTSFSPLGPDWLGFGTSSAQATIGGNYLGTNGTGTLDFRVSKAGTHGEDNLDLRVYDPADDLIETVQIKKNDPIGEVYTLSNGLTLTLSAGDLIELDEFHVEVDASIPASYSPTDPVWNGVGSSAEITLGGVYDGSDGSGTFRFEVRRGGVHGDDDLQVRVKRPDGGTLQTLDIDKNDPLDQTYTLDNGMTFRFGPGELIKDDVFTAEVFDSVGSVVDPGNPFDGTGNDDPQFDPGLGVNAGSFDVNGVTITVAADDTLDAVLARITASSAGVSAAFDVASERVVLTQKTAGSAPSIVLANDTSDFLDAVKLSAATPVPGQDGGDPVHEPIAGVPALAGIGNGSFAVNGVAIAIDINVDSLADVIDRINQSSARVTATLDPASLRLSFVSNDREASLVLSDPTTGFLAATKIAPGTYDAVGARNASPAFARPDEVAARLRELPRHLLPLLRNTLVGLDSEEADELRGVLRGAVEETFTGYFGPSPIPILRSGFGLSFDFSRGDGPTIEYERNKIRRALRSETEELQAFLFRDEVDTGRGLIPSLLSAVESLQSRVAVELGSPGLQGAVVDFRA